MFSFIKRHKILSGVICVNIVAIIVVAVIAIIHFSKTATVDIYVAPGGATVRLNGREYENFESHDLAPGNYRVEISMEGMQTKAYDLELKNGEYARIRTYLLDANGGFSYYVTHPEDEYVLSQIVEEDDKEAKAFIADYDKKRGIIDILPIDFDDYTDDFAYYVRYKIRQDYEREDCPKVACLIIEDNTGGNEERAKEKIKEYGYNLEDYEITYELDPLYGSVEGDN